MEKQDIPKLPNFNDKELSDMAIEMMELEALERVKKELPNLPKHVQEIQKSRGAGLESAIMCEQVLNYILAYMGYNVIKLTFGDKINKITEILKNNIKEDRWLQETIENLQKIKRLRNIYAHTPGDYQSGELRFDPSERYYQKEDEEFRFKPLNELNNIFADLDEDLKARISEIFKRLVPIREKEKLNSE